MVENRRIIVAIDCASQSQAEALLSCFSPADCRVKVGHALFTHGGPAVVRRIVDAGFDVFLDLKFHDIPNTVVNAVAAAADMGVWMVNLHCSAGPTVMEAVANWAQKQKKAPLCIGVTALTSLSAEMLSLMGLPEPKVWVSQLAAMAQASGLDGVVCSAHEATRLRSERGADFVLVTPGIRLDGDSTDDQQRVMTPSEAITAGSHYLVMGRSITRSNNPAGALARVKRAVQSCWA